MQFLFSVKHSLIVYSFLIPCASRLVFISLQLEFGFVGETVSVKEGTLPNFLDLLTKKMLVAKIKCRSLARRRFFSKELCQGEATWEVLWKY